MREKSVSVHYSLIDNPHLPYITIQKREKMGTSNRYLLASLATKGKWLVQETPFQINPRFAFCCSITMLLFQFNPLHERKNELKLVRGTLAVFWQDPMMFVGMVYKHHVITSQPYQTSLLLHYPSARHPCQTCSRFQETYAFSYSEII